MKRNENVEDGLGKFYVEKISKDNMVIRRKKNIKNGYNQIVVYEYKGKNDPNLNNRNIEDFNLIPSFDVPEWVKNKYIGFNNIELKSVLLILNHPNKKVRKLLYNCIDIDEIRTSFYPNRKDFYDIQTVLPLGVYGAKAGKSFQKCEITTKNNLKPLTFINWMYDNDKDMDEFSNNFYRKTGIKINIIKIQPSELVKILNRYPRVYNLTVIIFDAVRNDLTAFFEPFAKETGFHDFIIHEIKDLYNKLIYEIDEDKKREIAIKMAEIIKDEALALPLYQSVRKLYYPPHIKNINVGRDFLQYPEISEFRW